ncbi:MAG: SdpI family protein [Opitutales bacterium]|nr:SdpI family protein [Opitutales bacterium]
MTINFLPFAFFLGLTCIAVGAAIYFAPRNPLLGLRFKYTLASGELWQKYNKIYGVFFAAAGALFCIAALNRSGEIGGMGQGFVMALCVFTLCLIYFSKKDFEKAKREGKIDFDFDEPEKYSAGCGANSQKKSSIFFCAFCAFIIFVLYAWILQIGQFMPERVVAHLNAAGEPDAYIASSDFALIINFLFWGTIFLCGVWIILYSNFFSKKPRAPFSLAVAPLDCAFAVAAMLCSVVALVNYLVCAMGTAEFDAGNFCATVLLVYGAGFGAVLILIALSGRNKTLALRKKSGGKKRRGKKF